MCNIMYFGHLTNFTLVLTLLYQSLSTMLSLIALFHPGHSCFMPLFPSSIHSHGHGSINGHGHDRIHGAPAKEKEKKRNGHDC